MGVVVGSGVEAWEQRNRDQAQRILRKVDSAALRAAAAGSGGLALPVMGDHPRPQGPFAAWLFSPGVWPEDSETALDQTAQELASNAKKTNGCAEDAVVYRRRVFDGGQWVGEGADAAERAYIAAEKSVFDLAETAALAAQLFKRLVADVERTKRLMRGLYDTMTAEIDAFLRSGSGQSVAQVAAIVGKYRSMVLALSGELHGCVAEYSGHFIANSPVTPNHKGPKVFAAGNTKDDSPDGVSPPSPAPSGIHHDLNPPTGRGDPRIAGGVTKPDSPGGPSQLVPGSGLPSLLGSGGGLPVSGLPAGGGGSPLAGFQGLSGLQGLFGGLGLPPGGMVSPAGLGSAPVSPASTPGLDFGRGLASGLSAAAPAAAAVPAAPVAPLTAPLAESAPVAAAPAAAPVAAATHAAAPAAAAGAGLAGGGLAPYGSVMPPAAPAAAAGAVAPAAAALAGEGAGSGAGSSAGLVPAVATRRELVALDRDAVDADLEMARRAVAELAGASCVVDAGLDWAVAVGHNPTGTMSLWVATNDGAAYVPPGVYLQAGMSVTAGFDEDFDARWLGWVNPAEKAVRAARAFGDTVGAVATTWGYPSEFLSDPDEGVREQAIGVAHGGLGGPASELSVGRVHRLATVDWRLLGDLKAADDEVGLRFARELTQRVAFGEVGSGVELSGPAQAVARALVDGGRPTSQQWKALEAEYESARLMMAAQRPGLEGVLDPEQVVSYRRVFIECRRLETLLCWKRSDPAVLVADVVYAAWVAGVRGALIG